MSRNLPLISVRGIILLILALLNGTILLFGYASDTRFYWGLILSSPLLLLALYIFSAG
ncbi:hypothetical protein [Terrimonas pollutisoli]|uniref:hypothetical protein n=1 Tax=Terrimonas pollutisoli TaxID=3034147 RepID=UPI0023EB6C27|nr:hypothetical protein [Terrimonas sp. H1YJ31]